MKNKRGFTLLELLVVVLIIGVLSAIALPQYQKAVLKARLHVGISLISSLYEAEQSYYLANGEFTDNIDALDIEIPHDDTCERWEEPGAMGYSCGWGQVDIEGNFKTLYFTYPAQVDGDNEDIKIAYVVYLMDVAFSNVTGGKFKEGTRYCFGRQTVKTAQEVCENMGGTFIGESSRWKYYELH